MNFQRNLDTYIRTEPLCRNGPFNFQARFYSYQGLQFEHPEAWSDYYWDTNPQEYIPEGECYIVYHMYISTIFPGIILIPGRVLLV